MGMEIKEIEETKIWEDFLLECEERTFLSILKFKIIPSLWNIGQLGFLRR